MTYFKNLDQAMEWDWFSCRAGNVLCSDMCGLVAHDGSDIQAICVVDTVGPDGCQVHFAIDNPMAIRNGLFTVFAELVYGTLGLQRMIGLVPESNVRALRLDKKIGFTEVARIPNGERTGVATVVLMMEKEDCKWYAGNGAVPFAEKVPAPGLDRGSPDGIAPTYEKEAA